MAIVLAGGVSEYTTSANAGRARRVANLGHFLVDRFFLASSVQVV